MYAPCGNRSRRSELVSRREPLEDRGVGGPERDFPCLPAPSLLGATLANYSLRCLRCSELDEPVEWDLYDITPEQFREAVCPECGSAEFEVMRFDAQPGAHYSWLTNELKDVNEKLNRILMLIDDEFSDAVTLQKQKSEAN